MGFPVVYTPEPTKPSGGAQPGTKALYDFAQGTFDLAEGGDEIHGLGIYNPRDVCGNPWPHWKCTGSQHASGRAGDSGVPVVRPHGHPEGHRLAAWLVTNHAELGIQEVIFAGRRWSNKLDPLPWERWPAYSGRSDHFDHVHWAQNAAGAAGLTLPMIQAVWGNQPAPAVPQEDDTMILVPSDGPEKGRAYLYEGKDEPDKNGHRKGKVSYIDSTPLLGELEKLFGKAQSCNGAVWAFLKG